MLREQFDAMEKSLEEATRLRDGNMSISVALWRLRGLMLGYRWAITHGWKDPLVDPEDRPCLTCHG